MLSHSQDHGRFGCGVGGVWCGVVRCAMCGCGVVRHAEKKCAHSNTSPCVHSETFSIHRQEGEVQRATSHTTHTETYT